MIAKKSLTGSGFYSTSEAPKILLLKFWFLYFQFLSLEIFLIPLLFAPFYFEIFFFIYKFVFSQILVFCFAGVVVGLGCYFFQIAKIRRSHYSSPLPFHLPSATNPPFPMPAINFSFFLNQPFNRHLRPLIGK